MAKKNNNSETEIVGRAYHLGAKPVARAILSDANIKP